MWFPDKEKHPYSATVLVSEKQEGTNSYNPFLKSLTVGGLGELTQYDKDVEEVFGNTMCPQRFSVKSEKRGDKVILKVILDQSRKGDKQYLICKNIAIACRNEGYIIYKKQESSETSVEGVYEFPEWQKINQNNGIDTKDRIEILLKILQKELPDEQLPSISDIIKASENKESSEN